MKAKLISVILACIILLSLACQIVCADEIMTFNMDVNSGKIRFTYLNTWYQNTDVCISVINNDTNEVVFVNQLKSNKCGMVSIEGIKIENSGDYTLVLYPLYRGSPITREFTFMSQSDLDALWEVAVSETDAEILAEKWDKIQEYFRLDVPFMQYLNNTSLFFERAAGSREEYSLGERNSANALALSEILNNIALYASIQQLNKSSSAKTAEILLNEVYKSIKTENPEFYGKIIKIRDNNADYYNEIVLRFMEVVKTTFNLSDVISELKQAVKAIEIKNSLAAFSKLSHITEVRDIVCDPDFVDMFNLENYITKYKSLKSTADVDRALAGKSFSSTEDFRNVFISALNKAAEKESNSLNKNKTVSTGGGSPAGVIGSTTENKPKTDVNTDLPFTDLDLFSWARKYISELYNNGVINGKTEELFVPSDNILREEIVKMIIKAFEIEIIDGDSNFEDVPQDSWFRPYIVTAKKNGIISGMYENVFGTGAIASRQDIAVILYNTLKFSGADMTCSIKITAPDGNEVSDYANEAVSFMIEKGIIRGNENGFILPKSYATRAEVAVMIGRICEQY